MDRPQPMPRRMSIPCAVLALASASGCGSRAVLVPESAPVRIGPNASARVYTMQDGEWRLSQNAVAIPEGWYLLSPSWVEKEPKP